MIRCAEKRPICRWSLLLLIAGWFLIALFVGETEVLSFLPGAAIPTTVLGLSAVLLAAYWLAIPFRRCLEGFDLRALILPHLVRFVGIYFLVLHARGLLPRQFAVPAGWGDIIVALGAVALLVIPGAWKNRTALLAWNIAGLIDILFVVKIAAAIVLFGRDSMAVMTHLPLSFLPTMVVPLIIFTHVLMITRLVGRTTRQAHPIQTSNPVQRTPISTEPEPLVR